MAECGRQKRLAACVPNDTCSPEGTTFMEYVDSLVVSVKTRKLTEAEAMRRCTVWAFWKAIAAISMQVNQRLRSSTRLCANHEKIFQRSPSYQQIAVAAEHNLSNLQLLVVGERDPSYLRLLVAAERTSSQNSRNSIACREILSPPFAAVSAAPGQTAQAWFVLAPLAFWSGRFAYDPSPSAGLSVAPLQA